MRLDSVTTLRLGGPARAFLEADTETAVVGHVSAADRAGEPLLVLGGGSNLVVADEGFGGTVVRIGTRGVDIAPDGEAALVTVAAGEDWDAVVCRTIDAGLAGLECLSGIPGRAGATPIQNVGAYGQEVAQTLTGVRAYDRANRRIIELTAAECGFGYRDSAFKHSARHGAAAPTGRYVVLSMTFELERSKLAKPVAYTELARALGLVVGERAPLSEVRSAVLALRRGKGMVLDDADPDTRSAGSFFTNPILDVTAFAALRDTVTRVCGAGTRIPQYPAGPGQVKVSAAWLIERAGFGRGYHSGKSGPARTSTKHTLALVNPGGATTGDILALAREIRDGVQAIFGVDLTAEPVVVGATI